jgi:hypothetical protein
VLYVTDHRINPDELTLLDDMVPSREAAAPRTLEGRRRLTPCYSCKQPRQPGHYLCSSCWGQLPLPVRRALCKRDALALARLRQLHAQLDAGMELSEIGVSA